MMKSLSEIKKARTWRAVIVKPRLSGDLVNQ
jgi:hypothetical protein